LILTAANALKLKVSASNKLSMVFSLLFPYYCCCNFFIVVTSQHAKSFKV
jgi:hypothetical protein